MKRIQQTFTVDLTTEEINVIVDALHNYYKENKEALSNNPNNPEKLTNNWTKAQTLRNEFATLINVSFMGKDS